MNNYYLPGDWNAICDRCGFKYKGSMLREEWQGLMVCPTCYEAKHPALFQMVPPPQPRPVSFTRPEGADVFVVGSPVAPPPGGGLGGPNISNIVRHPVDWLKIDNYFVDDGRQLPCTRNSGLDPDPTEGTGATQFIQKLERSLVVNPEDNSVAARFQGSWPHYNTFGRSLDPLEYGGYNEVKSYPSIIYGKKPGYGSTSQWPGFVVARRAPDGVSVADPSSFFPPSSIAADWQPAGGSCYQDFPSGGSGAPLLPMQLPFTSKTARFRGKVQENAVSTGRGHLSYDMFLTANSTQGTNFAGAPITHEIMIPVKFWGGYGKYTNRSPSWYDHDVTIDGVLYHVYYAKDSPVTPYPTIGITSASRAVGGVITFTTFTPHWVSTGKVLNISGCSDANFNGTWTVTGTPTSTTFTVTDAVHLTAASSSGGQYPHPDDPGPGAGGYYHGLTYNFGGLNPFYVNEETSAGRKGWKFIVFEFDAPDGHGGQLDYATHPVDSDGYFNIDYAKFLNHLATQVDSRGTPVIQNTEYVPATEIGIEPVWGTFDLTVYNYMNQFANTVVSPLPKPAGNNS